MLVEATILLDLAVTNLEDVEEVILNSFEPTASVISIHDLKIAIQGEC